MAGLESETARSGRISNPSSSAKRKQGKFDLVELAAGMPQGIQAVIDTRTRQRVNRRVSLLNFIFLAARTLDNKPDEEITADVLAHLQNIQRQLQIIWGRMELQRMAQAEGPDQLLEWAYLERLDADLDKEQLKAISQMSLQEIIDHDDRDFIRAFGRQIQNVIYRHILLRAISELWIEHLTQMEALRVSIRMEAYAQQDPLVQYKNQSTDPFKDLLADIRMGVITQMFRLQPARPPGAEPQLQPQRRKTRLTSGRKNQKKAAKSASGTKTWSEALNCAKRQLGRRIFWHPAMICIQ